MSPILRKVLVTTIMLTKPAAKLLVNSPPADKTVSNPSKNLVAKLITLIINLLLVKDCINVCQAVVKFVIDASKPFACSAY